MANDGVRFGFLGAGEIASTQLGPAVHAADGAVLQAAAARDPQRAAALEPRGRTYDDYRGVLEDPDVDVVYIALPNDQHYPWVRAALAAGKHVLCEKPLGLTAVETATMGDAARGAGLLLVEAFWYRWHPRQRALEVMVAEGAVGGVESVEAEFVFDKDLTGNYRLDPARGGGALYDVGCYTASAAIALLGEDAPPDAVSDVVVDRAGTLVDLTTEAVLQWPRGSARMRCGMAGPTAQRLTVTGELGRIEVPGQAFTSSTGTATELVVTRGGSVERLAFAPAEPYRIMVESVASAVRGEAVFLVPLEHSVSVAQALEDIRAAG
jgi:xylose dehydrogenase (NAD/NADP)